MSDLIHAVIEFVTGHVEMARWKALLGALCVMVVTVQVIIFFSICSWGAYQRQQEKLHPERDPWN